MRNKLYICTALVVGLVMSGTALAVTLSNNHPLSSGADANAKVSCCPDGDCCPDGACCTAAEPTAKKVSCCPNGACCLDGICCSAAAKTSVK